MSSLLVRLCACPSPYDVSAQDHDEGERVEEASLCSILNKLILTWLKLISNSNQVTGLEVLEIKRHRFHGPDVNLIKIGEGPVLLRRLYKSSLSPLIGGKRLIDRPWRHTVEIPLYTALKGTFAVRFSSIYFVLQYFMPLIWIPVIRIWLLLIPWCIYDRHFPLGCGDSDVMYINACRLYKTCFVLCRYWDYQRYQVQIYQKKMVIFILKLRKLTGCPCTLQ